MQVCTATRVLVLVAWATLVVCQRNPSLSTNFASAYLGAKVVQVSPEAKGVHHLLRDDSSYMIVPCGVEKKHFTVQLAREVHVLSLLLHSLEYFSSIIENFVVLGSTEYPCSPPCRWHVIGRFTANFSREMQIFDVASGLEMPTARYVRVLWVSHYGTEKSCTLSSFQVFGQDHLELVSSVMVVDDDDSSLSDSDASNATDSGNELGPRVPISPPWLNATNASSTSGSTWVTWRCPATVDARDIEVFLARRQTSSEVCAANYSKPSQPRLDLQSTAAVFNVQLQRQLSGVKKNLSLLASQVAQAALKDEHADLVQQLQRIRQQLENSTSRIDELSSQLTEAHQRLGVLSAVVLTFGALVATATLFNLTRHEKSRSVPGLFTGTERDESSDTDVPAHFRRTSSLRDFEECAGSEDDHPLDART